MDKNKIKKFAIDARKKLIASVTDRAGMLGITEKEISSPVSSGADFEVYLTSAGTEVTLDKKQCEHRRKLVEQITARGFEAVMEEVAYTWFNRLCAIRFMEVNDYMYPARVRVLSSEKEGKKEPDIVTLAPDIDWDFTEAQKEEIIELKMNGKLDELFRKLFIKQCNLLHEVLPGLFEETQDYTEMLLSISFTNEDDVVRMLIDGVDEQDFDVNSIGEDGKPTGQVEIIGWLYQYYNTELKDDTFAKLKKNVKITKERIPAATQLFTPDWIVRYMVENSVGRIWIEHLRAVDANVDEKETAEKFGWKYYLPEAEQESEVNLQLAEIRKSYKDLQPTDIRCIDPCMGSGHILIAMFDVLMDIYKSAGYSERDAAFEIVENNIHGLDIDQRAYQLAYFAVMMKGRGYNRRFFRGKDDIKPVPRVYAIMESNEIDKNQLQFFGKSLKEDDRNKAVKQLEYLLHTFVDAREYGSILNVEECDWDLLEKFVNDLGIEGQYSFESVGSEETQEKLCKLVQIAKLLGQKYKAVITNPPYMGGSGMDSALSKYVRDNYSNSKADLFAVFIERCCQMANINGYQAMITQHAWMFLSSFEKLRRNLLSYDTVNMAHFGARAFDEIGGEVVQTTSFVLRKNHMDDYKGTYFRLIDPTNEHGKEKMFLMGENYYIAQQNNFLVIPGSPIAYWVSKKVFDAFTNFLPISKYAEGKVGLQTGNNDIFLRLWHEISFQNICFTADSSKKWFPYNKGGSYRRWYGNNEYIVNWSNDGKEIKHYKGAFPRNTQYYFLKGMTWSDVATGLISMRVMKTGFAFDTCAPCLFPMKDYMELLGFMNTKVAQVFMDLMSPTMHYTCGSLVNVPFSKPDSSIAKYVEESINISTLDWDSFETSWDFKVHPLISVIPCNRLLFDNTNDIDMAECFNCWENECNERFNQLKANEEELNRIFIDIYGLQDELTPEVEDKDVTVRKADLGRDIRSFISYAVGCMFGRYSLDEQGLIYAGGDWNASKYSTFIPDADNIIPITDEEYFTDDIVSRFVEFVKTVYGEVSLETNLDFIANALGNKGATSREVIRNYFLKDFYADHLKIYQKRPIYWLFDSGKQNGFKALIYMHRYDADTVGRVRTDYLHRAQNYVETAMKSAQYTIETSSSSSDKSKATKAVTKYTNQLAEMQLYDEAIAHIANQRIEIDLDDGVKVNYAKFQGVEVAQEGKKTIKIDLLAKI